MNDFCGKPGSPLSLTAVGHQCIRSVLNELATACARGDAGNSGLVCVDATCGNGHDTRFLLSALEGAGLAPCGQVLAFDIQSRALLSTQNALNERCTNPPVPVTLLQQDHALLAEALQAHAPQSSLAVVVYNLGFLPRSDKAVVTQAPSTIASLQAAADLLMPGGIIVAHAYSGHPGGSEECAAVAAWLAALPHNKWLAGEYALTNKPRNPERLFLAQKRQRKKGSEPS